MICGINVEARRIMTRFQILAAVAVCAICGAISYLSLAAMAADEDGAFDLSWHTIDGGGGTSSGGDLQLHGSIGQPDAGAMSGGEFELTGGFWIGVGTPVPVCPADIAPVGGDGVVNVIDLLAVISGWGVCAAPCPPCHSDVNHDCQTNVADLLAVLNAWGACP